MRALATACKTIQQIPLPHNDVLPALTKWVFGTANRPDIHDENKLRLVLPHAIPLRKPVRIEGDDNTVESVSLCVFRNPKDILNEKEKFQLHSLMLPYTLRAFCQDVETVSNECVEDHCNHQILGDLLFVAVANSNKTKFIDEEICDGLLVNPPGPQPPRVIFHLLCSTISIDIKGILNNYSAAQGNVAERASRTAGPNVMCGAGYCTDPIFQQTGIATLVHDIVVQQFLKPQAVILRTANPAMVKLLKRNAPAGSRLYPNDLILENDEERNSKNTFGLTKEHEWNFARAIGNAALPLWSQLSADAAKYDPERLVFRGAYAVYKVDDVFKSGSANSGDIEVAPGDAQLRILLLPMS